MYVGQKWLMVAKRKRNPKRNKMPITRKNFEIGNYKARQINRTNHPIAVLLRKYPNLAFTVKEIVSRTKMKEYTIRSMLRRLREDDLIVHKSPYFAWKKRSNPKPKTTKTTKKSNPKQKSTKKK